MSNMEKKAMAPIGQDERQSWASIAFIWIGIIICVPMLMVGSLMASGLSLWEVIAVILIGFGITGGIMCLTGIIGSDLGLPSAMVSTKGFGNTGSRVIVSLISAVSAIGWFGIQTAFCGSAFSQLMLSSFNVDFPLWLSNIIWGAVMVWTAIYGFKFLKVLNYIAVPALLVLCVYGIVATLQGNGAQILASYHPSSPMPFVSAISTMVGLLATGMVISSDYSRYAKNRSATVKATLIGVVPAALIVGITGAITSIVTGKSDITAVFAGLGMPVISMVVLILATWTTNTGNAYVSGLAIVKVFNIKDSKRPLTTLILGIIGTALALLGVANLLTDFLNFLSAAVPPVAGVMIADYWILGRGKKQHWHVVKGFNWIGVISWAAGFMIGFFVHVFNAAVDSVVVALVLYAVLTVLFGKKAIAGKGAMEIEDAVNQG